MYTCISFNNCPQNLAETKIMIMDYEYPLNTIRIFVNPNQAGLCWLCYIWGGGGGADSAPPPPEILAVIRAIVTKFCTRVALDVIYMTA